MRASRACLAISIAVSLFPFAAPGATTNWAGRTWTIRHMTNEPTAPGPNLWSTNCVWVDTNGWLHLQIKKIGADWYCGEVETTNSLGYGEYRWYVVNRVGDMDTNAVGGLFTYEEVEPGDNEVDIEFTKSFTPDGFTNLHYTVQPYYEAGHQRVKAMALTNENTTHRFVWNPGHIHWQSWQGHTPNPPDTNAIIDDWTYVSNDVPLHADEHCFINLWLFLGYDPVETNKLEMIVKDFTFTASTGTLVCDEFDDTSRSNCWGVFGTEEPGSLVESNNMLKVHVENQDDYSLGYYTTNPITWANDGLAYHFSASLRTVLVSQVSTGATAGVDYRSLQALISGVVWYDPWWASNAANLRCGYDSSNDSLQVEFYAKTNWIQSLGNLLFRGTITNVAAYGDTNGLDLQFILEGTNYYVQAYYLGAGVPIATNSGATFGPHYLGSALYSGYYELGAQNEKDGRGYLYWNRTRVYTTPAVYTQAPPPVVTNDGTVVQIGTNSTTWRYPLNTRYNKSRITSLYTSNQVGRSGTITQLEIYVTGYPRIPMSNYTIRLQMTSLTNLPTTWVSNGWTTVYCTNTQINSAGWFAFPFATPFAYTSKSNLLVDLSFNNSTRESVGYGYARYSTGPGFCNARSGNVSTDPLAWTGTEPSGSSGKDVYRTNRFVNVRLLFDGPTNSAAPPGEFSLRDEFSDTLMDPMWERLGDWDGAVYGESNGVFSVKPGSWDWQTSGYVATNEFVWSDTNGWFVFFCSLSSVRVDAVTGGEDLRTIFSACSAKENAWYVPHSVCLQGRYDADSNRMELLFFTKTQTPSSEGTSRFDGTLTNASAYWGGTNRLQMRIVLGAQKYDLRFADAAGQQVAVFTNSGATFGDHNLGTNLYRCYWVVGAENTITGRGAALWDRTILATSAAPAVWSAGALQTSTDGLGLVSISNAFYDINGDESRLRVEASTNGGSSWFGAWVSAVSGTRAAAAAGAAGAFQALRVASTNGAGLPATNWLTVTWDTLDAGNGVSLSGQVCTNVRVRLTPDDLAVEGASVTTAVFSVDNQAPSAGGASVVVETNAAFTFNTGLNAAWSGFADLGSSIAGYYCGLSDGGGTTSGSWSAASPATVGGAVPDATNTVFVWARDAYGNIGTAASDSILVLSSVGDWDADTHDNLDEFFWGTDPLGAGSTPWFDIAGAAAGGLPLIRWGSIDNRHYSLYFTDEALSNGVPWWPVEDCTNWAGTAGSMTYTDETPIVEHRFFRLKVSAP